MTLKTTQRTPAYSVRSRNKKRQSLPCSTQAGNASFRQFKIFTAFMCFQMTTKGIDLGVTSFIEQTYVCVCVKFPFRKIKDQDRNIYWAIFYGEWGQWTNRQTGPSSMVTWMSKVEHGEVCLWKRKQSLPGEGPELEPRGSSSETGGEARWGGMWKWVTWLEKYRDTSEGEGEEWVNCVNLLREFAQLPKPRKRVFLKEMTKH